MSKERKYKTASRAQIYSWYCAEITARRRVEDELAEERDHHNLTHSDLTAQLAKMTQERDRAKAEMKRIDNHRFELKAERNKLKAELAEVKARIAGLGK